jgi:uncharacterized protein YggT (Ycf19 family)
MSGNVVTGIAATLSFFLQAYQLVLIGRAIVSWVDAPTRNPIVQFLILATEPALRVIRRLLPVSLRYFPLDIAFLVLLGLTIFLQYALVQSLFDLGLRLRAS